MYNWYFSGSIHQDLFNTCAQALLDFLPSPILEKDTEGISSRDRAADQIVLAVHTSYILVRSYYTQRQIYSFRLYITVLLQYWSQIPFIPPILTKISCAVGQSVDTFFVIQENFVKANFYNYFMIKKTL